MARAWVVGLVACGVLGAASAAEAVLDTVHNLSVRGARAVGEAGGGQACAFCHIPHNVKPSRALWSQALPAVTYTLYSSSTLEATLQQPTGASRLCLSCHDGTLAIGNPQLPTRTGRVTLGRLSGRAALGTDLSDDHPVSFVYDSALSLKQGQLADPATLPRTVLLDRNGQLQCTSCHDPHVDRYRQFLRMDDRAAALCTACHQHKNWSTSTHATSPATWRETGSDPWPNAPYRTVTENGCENCHRAHSAPRPPRLLSRPQEPQVCLVCHDGSVASEDLEREFLKASAHPIASADWTHEPMEDPNTMPRHVTCADCHNPHQTSSTPASPPVASGRLRGVPGVNISGGTVREVTYEYEICLKCHGMRDQTTSVGIVRQDNTRNVRLEISQSNPSYHPVAAVGRNPDMGGFEPRYSTGTIIYCSDCHNNDQWTVTGKSPRGPHGSRYAPLLEREYQMDDPTPETLQSYDLCYKCHNRSFLINDRAGTFPHRSHVRDGQASCAACHDAHGSRQHVGLINFMARDHAGNTVVAPSSSGRLEFVSTGRGSGRCFLRCHGVDHDPREYPLPPGA